MAVGETTNPARRAAGEAALGPNAWLVDEMYDNFLADPESVGVSWRDFFADFRRPGSVPETVSEPAEATRLVGAAGRMVDAMEASLAVPTATSARVVPARLLEVNRKVLNGHLGRTGGGRVSFTHLIGYAVVRAVAAVPTINATFVRQDGRAMVIRHEHVGLGLAVDITEADGSHKLLVPCLPDADTLDFDDFRGAYEDLVRKVRTGRAGADDFAGTTLTLTNPGTFGTVHSVPRLMVGQGAIVGIGAVGWPAEYQAADPRALAQLGVSKVVTLTSTYDHRMIAGAESGQFLAKVHELLLGADGFYDLCFRSVGVPYEPVRWRPDVNPADGDRAGAEKQVGVHTLINLYRVRGHLIADLDPLEVKEPRTHPELDPATYGLTIWDLDREFFAEGVGGHDTMTLGELLGVLRDAYCRRIGVEYMHIQDPAQKRWIQTHIEGTSTDLSIDEQLHILDRLNAAESFERFLHTKYVGHKRFGLEGAESAIPLVDELLDASARAGAREAVLGMAHRGRLNVLANVVGTPLAKIFREFEGDIDPATIQGSGDVRYHVGANGTFVGRSGISLPITLSSNPSHVEAVDPVVEGMVRAKQDLLTDPEDFVVPIVIHGDAAFAGQGVVAETLNLSALPGYRVGGTVHLVINNQLGFTTAPESARSSVYPTDVAKTVQAPIFHVNGDDPEACVRVARLAFAFRQQFAKDVVIDMVCYRRHGHNEGDDPSYTQPLMYRRIDQRRSVRKLYTEVLVRRGDITLDEAEKALDDFSARMATAFHETRHSSPPQITPEGPTGTDVEPYGSIATGVSGPVLDRVVDALHSHPGGFTVHPKLARQIDARRALYDGGEVDWPLAEALALGSLLGEGIDIRLAGQDSRRGTFSQRHAVLVDYTTGEEWTPLGHIKEEGPSPAGRFWIYDSMLSEYAALGFEYGWSVAHSEALVAWEAQFGDFVNGAQIIVDQFIVAAEDKWRQRSGLVLLLPHGQEGQGPEHSSARLERFLSLCAAGNIAVAQPTDAAQYFHLLRAQALRRPRRPLVILTAKSLLRARCARSGVETLTFGSFAEIVDDPAWTGDGAGDATLVQRVALTSGKVAYDAMARRDEAGAPLAVVRLEQLHPWPERRLLEVLAGYPNADEVFWLQEEPENMGAWTYVHERLHAAVRDRTTLRHVSRPPSASPSSGSLTVHLQEQELLVDRVLEGL